jgi:outer membrane protein assembly factor BamA
VPSSLITRAIAVALCLAPAAFAAAQDTRAEAIADEQAQKAASLHPYVPPLAERIFGRLQEGFLREPGGFFPYFDSVYSGGGFTLGAGYRQFYGDNTLWEIKGLYSIKNYKNIEVGTRSRGHARDRLDFDAHAGWRDATQVGYYGLGIDTVPDARANFRMKQTYFSGAAAFRPIRWVVLRAGLAYEDYNIEEGAGSVPSIADVYNPATAPGLGASPSYVHTQGTAGIDSRTSPGYSRRGGYYGVTVHDYADVNDTFDFNRLDADVVQHIPILRETWVVSLRGRLQTEIGDDSNTPFFLLPALGSGSTLRGYSSWRFRDRHAWLMSAEWRWIPNRLGLDMAIFYDAGQVAPERSDFAWDRRKSNWGLGARFHSPIATPLRIELAHGSDGWHLVFAASAAF